MATISTMTFEEYKDVQHSVPYVLHLKSRSGAELLYYGARHSCDPSAPMFDDMQARFREFQPKVALTEGGVSPVRPDRDETIKQFGEGGYLCFLCHAHGVPVLNLEPPFDAEVKHLLASYSREQLLLFYCVQQIIEYRLMRSKPSYEKYMGHFAEWVARRLQLEVPMAPLAFLHMLYRETFGHELDWEAITEETVSPLVWDSFTNEISRESSYFRDPSHVATLTEAVQAHHKVFAVVGVSHVVMQERALREAFADV